MFPFWTHEIPLFQAPAPRGYLDKGTLVNDCRTIALHYLRTWFVVDLAVSFLVRKVMWWPRLGDRIDVLGIGFLGGAWKTIVAVNFHQLETSKTQVFPVALKKKNGYGFLCCPGGFLTYFFFSNVVSPGSLWGKWFQRRRLHRFALRVFSSLQQHWRHRDGHALLETLGPRGEAWVRYPFWNAAITWEDTLWSAKTHWKLS